MKPVVAFAGRKGSGKTARAAFLVSHGYTELALADELKSFALALFPRVLTQAILTGPSSARDRAFTLEQRRLARSDAQAAVMNIRHDPEVRDRALAYFKGAPRVPTNYDLADQFSAVFADTEKALASPRTILQHLGTEWGRAVWDEVWLNAARVRVEKAPGRYVIPDGRFPNELVYLKAQLGAAIYWLEADKRLGPGTDDRTSEPQKSALIGLCDGEIDTSLDESIANTRLLELLV